MQPRHPWLALWAGTLIMVSLGPLHSFSVFLQPLESVFGARRGAVSLTYSLALISLTVLVLIGHRVYGRLSPPLLIITASFVAASGLVMASMASTLLGVYVGYGIVFGGANGLVYGFLLQLVAQALPKSRGLAMGIVTGSYALGAVIYVKVFSLALVSYSVSQTMLYMAGLIVVTGIVVCAGLWISNVDYVIAPGQQSKQRLYQDRVFFKLWMAYGFGSAAGLMAIGHAAGIVVGLGGTSAMVVFGAMIIGLGNAIAGFLAGYLADRMDLKTLLIGLPILSATALMVLLGSADPHFALGVLAVVGFAYGAMIAVYPAAVTERYGVARAARVYGWVFTAWGVAGLTGPWVAGALYDLSGTYSVALGLAALAGVISASFALALPRAFVPAP